MGLLDAWSQRALQRRDVRVQFIREHSGKVEDTFKRDLILELTTRPPILRAYFATVTFGTSDEEAIALCIRSDTGEDRSFVVRVGEMYRRRFGTDVVLDVVFLTADQEAELAPVCKPFYSRGTPG